MNKWISVKKYYPELNVKVLVSVGCGDKSDLMVAWRDKVGWLSTGVCWWFENDEINQTLLSGDVTHWMPLPDPPEDL